ncbi:hypothetical protein DFH09DRAFT_1327131 [Mycena vulgaris]|nr:hypothetical protein DFH09DRAFT_1327131 [Mycena vulgaris]
MSARHDLQLTVSEHDAPDLGSAGMHDCPPVPTRSCTTASSAARYSAVDRWRLVEGSQRSGFGLLQFSIGFWVPSRSSISFWPVIAYANAYPQTPLLLHPCSRERVARSGSVWCNSALARLHEALRHISPRSYPPPSAVNLCCPKRCEGGLPHAHDHRKWRVLVAVIDTEYAPDMYGPRTRSARDTPQPYVGSGAGLDDDETRASLLAAYTPSSTVSRPSRIRGAREQWRRIIPAFKASLVNGKWRRGIGFAGSAAEAVETPCRWVVCGSDSVHSFSLTSPSSRWTFRRLSSMLRFPIRCGTGNERLHIGAVHDIVSACRYLHFLLLRLCLLTLVPSATSAALIDIPALKVLCSGEDQRPCLRGQLPIPNLFSDASYRISVASGSIPPRRSLRSRHLRHSTSHVPPSTAPGSQLASLSAQLSESPAQLACPRHLFRSVGPPLAISRPQPAPSLLQLAALSAQLAAFAAQLARPPPLSTSPPKLLSATRQSYLPQVSYPRLMLCIPLRVFNETCLPFFYTTSATLCLPSTSSESSAASDSACIRVAIPRFLHAAPVYTPAPIVVLIPMPFNPASSPPSAAPIPDAVSLSSSVASLSHHHRDLSALSLPLTNTIHYRYSALRGSPPRIFHFLSTPAFPIHCCVETAAAAARLRERVQDQPHEQTLLRIRGLLCAGALLVGSSLGEHGSYTFVQPLPTRIRIHFFSIVIATADSHTGFAKGLPSARRSLCPRRLPPVDRDLSMRRRVARRLNSASAIFSPLAPDVPATRTIIHQYSVYR